MSEFHGKVVIVTGGAKGIGKGICEAFAKEGSQVLCADVDIEAGEQLSASRPNISFMHADVSQSAVCQSLVETAVDTWQRLDILCNNVGIQPTTSYVRAHELSEEQWDRIIDINLTWRFLMAIYCIHILHIQGGGVIISTASVQGLQSAPQVSAYAASKGGDLSLMRQLALDYAQDNIRVLAINPGAIDTPLVQEALDAEGGDQEEARRQMAEMHPINRIGQPADIAQTVLFLASSKASFMTGSYVNVDGGLMAKGAWG